MHPRGIGTVTLILAALYRYYFRVETRGIENIRMGRMLLVANHAGNTLPMDGAMLGQAMLLEAEPPRIARGMAEFYLPQILWFSEQIHRLGSGSPGLLDAKALGRLIGAPAFPITWTFPLLGVLGFLPLPVKYRLIFGEPIRLLGDATDDDRSIQMHVERPHRTAD